MGTFSEYEDELRAVVARFECEFDEPESLGFVARARASGILNAAEWKEILVCLEDAMGFLRAEAEAESEARHPINVDADPRNADWIKIVGAWRRIGYRVPSWATLWLWRIGYSQHEGALFWRSLGRLAAAEGFEAIDRNH